MHLDSLHASEITSIFFSFSLPTKKAQLWISESILIQFDLLNMILKVPVLGVNEWLNSDRPVLPTLMALSTI